MPQLTTSMLLFHNFRTLLSAKASALCVALAQSACPAVCAGFYELLRVYKRVGSVAKVQALLQEAAAKQVPVKEDVLEDTQAWLEKRGAT